MKRFGYPILISIDFDDFTSSFYSLVFVSIEKTHQTLETVVHGLSKHLEFRQKYSTARRVFNSLLSCLAYYLQLVYKIVTHSQTIVIVLAHGGPGHSVGCMR